MIPLAGPANKQGRIAADNIAGLNAKLRRARRVRPSRRYSTLSVASTGEKRKDAHRARPREGKGLRVHHHHPEQPRELLSRRGSDDAQAALFQRRKEDLRRADRRQGRAWTSESTPSALQRGSALRSTDLKRVGICLCPAVSSSAKDPVNMLGFVAENVLKGIVKFSPWNVIEKQQGTRCCWTFAKTRNCWHFRFPARCISRWVQLRGSPRRT